MTVQSQPIESAPSKMTVHNLFEQQARKTPNQTAMEYGGETLSYQSLDSKADELANRLRAQGVGPDSVVALCVKRSTRMVIGVLGIMKSGAAYLPIDHKDPQQRVEFMLHDSASRIIVTETGLAHRFRGFNGPCLLIDERNEDVGTIDLQTSIPARPENLANIIYISGATGKPKGVAIEHRSVVQRLLSMSRRLGISDREVVLSVGPYTFDVTLPDWFWALMFGGKVIVVEEPVFHDPKLMIAEILSKRPTHLQAAPHFWDLMIAEGTQWPRNIRIISTGEHMSEVLRDQLRSRNDEVWNLYGPTETTIWACACHIGKDTNHNSIGTPLENTPVYIQNSSGQLAKVNEIGELLIGGVGLAREYLCLPELTKKRFSPIPEIGSARLYRTGDLARWNADGTIAYLGRIDHQVKFRGLQIELEEIDSVLQTHDDVVSSVTVIREDQPGDKQIHSYVVLKKNSQARFWEFRDFLGQILPEYMIPAGIEDLDALPMNSNGKVNRAALPEPKRMRHLLKQPYVAPSDDIQGYLATIWMEVLNLDDIGVDDNFFDVGGHSLTAIKLINRIEQAFQKRMSVSSVFGNPTIRLFSELLQEQL
jgi:amino acid adenylation domain-containing protein